MYSSEDDCSYTINRLQTLILYVEDPTSKTLKCLRCLADTGASHSFLDAKRASELNLGVLETRRMSIKSFGKKQMRRVGIVQTNSFVSHDVAQSSLKIKFLTVENLTFYDTSTNLSPEQLRGIEECNAKLADPKSAEDGHLKVDAIIGQDWYYSIVDGNILTLPGGLKLIHTIFDTYMLAGSSVYNPSELRSDETKTLTNDELNDINENLDYSHSMPKYVSNFATFDTLSSEEEQDHMDSFSRLDILGVSPDEDIHPVLDKFKKTVQRVGDRFEVFLPKKKPQLQNLQSNCAQAFSRTVGGLKKRQRNSDKTELEKYDSIIQEYLEKGILERVASLGTVQEVRRRLAENPNAFDRIGVYSEDAIVCYLPHHGVHKASTGKLRVVYDAKARPYKGALSLNDCLEKGPNLMNSLIRILMRFRKGKIAAKSDIEKAFLMVGIHPSDRDLLRIFWLDGDQVWIYKFTRLPFGLCCSPFLLGAVMQHTLFNNDIDEETRDLILSAFYVDDSVDSKDTLKELLKSRDTAVHAFGEAGMILRDWTSNDPEARAIFSSEENDRTLPEDETVLGLAWNLKSDTIGINHTRIIGLIGQIPKTKRALWSFAHSLYDPLGLIAPYTIQAKFLMNEASKQVKGWNSGLPLELGQKVVKWMEDFIHIKDFRFPRWVELDNPKSRKLVGFCDASSKGIAACVYLVCSDGQHTISHLIKANTHIPKDHLKTKIPRLELLGSVMLSILMTEVLKAYPEIVADDVHYFTDSADVLYWIYSGSTHCDIWVANRVKDIRNLTVIKKWKHVTSAENPADIPSRGCSLGKLKDLVIWKHGPSFIREDMIDHNSTVKGYDAPHMKEVPPGCLAEMNLKINLASVDEKSVSHKVMISKVINITDFHSYHKLITVTSMVLKFLNILNVRRCERLGVPGLLNVVECEVSDSVKLRAESELLWIRATQALHFHGMFLLSRNAEAQTSSSDKTIFFQHGIFCEPTSGVLCCTSRLQNSELPTSAVFPMLLPSHSTFTELYIRHAHEKVGHQGVPQTLTYTRKEFWVLRGRRAVQSVLHRCNQCRKVEGKAFPLPPHPPLPDIRTKRNQAFSATGLDFTGPFHVKSSDIDRFVKVYVLLLTCARTRCVHLEVTRSLGLNDFMMALERFFSFRGIPQHLESDNAATFFRCNQELKSLLDSKRAQKYFDINKKIHWNFYTSRSPHMGGFIEKLNDIFKRISRKTFGKTTAMDFEEFRTMIAYSMAVMNDRPLTYVYSGSCSEGMPLSPNKLTLGYDVLEPPHIRFEWKKDKTAQQYGDQFAHLENVKDEFWKQWNDQYLTELYEHHVRNNKRRPNLRVPKLGDVCLLMKEKVPRRRWKLCKIVGFKKPRRDQHIRECRVKLLTERGNFSILKRSPQFLVPLEVEPHTLLNDPLVNSVVPFIPTGSDVEVIKTPLPPYWTQPVKLPDSAHRLPSRKGKAGKGFRKKGKFPLAGVKRVHSKAKVLKQPDVMVQNPELPSQDEKSGASAVNIPSNTSTKKVMKPDTDMKDPTWKPMKPGRLNVDPTTRVLRQRHITTHN